MFRWKRSLKGVTRKPECGVEYLDDPMVTLKHDHAPGEFFACVIFPEEPEGKVSPPTFIDEPSHHVDNEVRGDIITFQGSQVILPLLDNGLI
jgi:hypothetical protein